LNFFAEAFLVEERAAKSYKYFIETFIMWQKLFDNHGDPISILNLPFPLYHDIILKQVEEKKAEKKRFEEERKKHKQLQSKIK